MAGELHTLVSITWRKTKYCPLPPWKSRARKKGHRELELSRTEQEAESSGALQYEKDKLYVYVPFKW